MRDQYARVMHPNDPLPRLLRLRSMVTHAAPSDKVKPEYSDAKGLTDAYETLRNDCRELVAELQMSTEEFDSKFQALDAVEGVGIGSPHQMLGLVTQASTAATQLRTLQGYIEGLITMTIVTEDLKPEQIELISRLVSD